MVSKDDEEFPGISTRVLRLVLVKTLQDADLLLKAGLPLPEYEPLKGKKSKSSASKQFGISNAGLADHLRVSLEIAQMAADLRKNQGPKSEP